MLNRIIVIPDTNVWIDAFEVNKEIEMNGTPQSINRYEKLVKRAQKALDYCTENCDIVYTSAMLSEFKNVLGCLHHLSEDEINKHIKNFQKRGTEITDFDYKIFIQQQTERNIITPSLRDKGDRKFFALAMFLETKNPDKVFLISNDKHITNYKEETVEDIQQAKKDNIKYIKNIPINKIIIPEVSVLYPDQTLELIAPVREEFEKLIIAIENNASPNEVNELIPNVDIHAQNKDGNTALMIACQKSNYNIVELLLANDADMNMQNDAGKTALMLMLEQETTQANMQAQVMITNTLLASDVRLNVADNKKKTIIDYLNIKNDSSLFTQSFFSNFIEKYKEALFKSPVEKKVGENIEIIKKAKPIEGTIYVPSSHNQKLKKNKAIVKKPHKTTGRNYIEGKEEAPDYETYDDIDTTDDFFQH